MFMLGQGWMISWERDTQGEKKSKSKGAQTGKSKDWLPLEWEEVSVQGDQ